jgi:hypothetical protein
LEQFNFIFKFVNRLSAIKRERKISQAKIFCQTCVLNSKNNRKNAILLISGEAFSRSHPSFFHPITTTTTAANHLFANYFFALFIVVEKKAMKNF